MHLLAVLAVVGALLTGHMSDAAIPQSAQRLRALERLLQAAAADDEPAMWAALSRISRRRLGPTLVDFRERGARGVRAGVAPFAEEAYRVIVNSDLRRELGLVGIARRQEAFAVPVRQERDGWKVEIDPLFTIEAVRPLPGERVLRRTQLAAEVAAPAIIDGAAMWIDGRVFNARAYWSPNRKRMSMWGEAPQPLANGRHTVVAFASAGPVAAANAWTFTVRGRGSGSR